MRRVLTGLKVVLGSTTLLTLGVCFSQAQLPPPNDLLMVEIKQPFSPDPAFPGEKVSAEFSLFFKTNALRQEAQSRGIADQTLTLRFDGGAGVVAAVRVVGFVPVPGKMVPFDYTFSGLKAGESKTVPGFGLKGTLSNSREELVITGDDKSPTITCIEADGRFDLPGSKAIQLHASVKPKTALQAAIGLAQAPGQLKDAAVLISPDPIVTGFLIDPNTKKLTKSLERKAVVRVSANQKIDLTKDVDIVPEGKTKEAQIKIIEAKPDAVTILVLGLEATPATVPQGDLELVVKDKKGKQDLVSATILVVIPAAVGVPHPLFKGEVKPKNVALDSTTRPPFQGLPENKVVLVSLYATDLPIPVVDQFKKPLSDIYAGAPVTETLQAKIVSINSPVNDKGIYQDAVGFSTKKEKDAIIDKFVDQKMKVLNPAIKNWEEAQPVPMLEAQVEPQKIPVQVGGHELNPAIVNRVIFLTLPNKLEVIWADPK